MRPPVAPAGPTTEELPIGRVFGPYKILSAIQRGGMGELFLAERVDRRTPNKVVLKRLLADYLEDERYVRMFRSEAKVMSSLDHPNIVKVFDVPVIDGKQCLAMEYVQGRNLAQILRRCRELNTAIPPQVALHIVIDVLRGLDYAHNFVLDDGRPLGLVHRDVTPPNILVSFEGAVKITDFGISKSEMSSVSTTIGVVKGTTRYLAPEQIRGQAATPRSDIFSAAVVLVEVLTGEALFDHGTVPPTLFAIVTGQRKPIAELLPFPAPKLVVALERALDLHPDRRFRTAREFADALEEAERELGRPIEKNGLSTFLKELFRGAEQPHDLEEEIGPWKLDAMDLTYLFEVQELNAFKPEVAASPYANRSDELQRVKALLKAAVPGANPLDADQFAEKREELAGGLSSPSSVRREPTRFDRPKTEPGPPAPVFREPLADTGDVADVFSDPTQTSGDVESHTEDSVDIIRIDPASLPEARLPTPPPVRVYEDRTHIVPETRRTPRRFAVPVAFVLGMAAGAAIWSQVGSRVAQPAARVPATTATTEGDPPAIYPSIQHARATAYEGVRPGVPPPPPPPPGIEPPARLTIRRPINARVRVNGQWLDGRTPIVDYAITPGEVRIEVVKRRQRKRYRVEARAGQSIDLTRR
jgi:serine/threonine protein kinase